jgi:radical SAM protein with 4Fe4S-binding SPASM domain
VKKGGKGDLDGLRLVSVDSQGASRLYEAKSSPEEILEKALGPRFSVYRARWERARTFRELPPYPLHVDIEERSDCNYRCPMCPMSGRGDGGKPQGKDQEKSREKGREKSREKGRENSKENSRERRLGIQKIKDIVLEGSENGQAALGFGGLWEPLLFEGLPEVVAYARERGLVDVLLNTNGSLLERDLSRSLIEAGLTRLMISLDAATEGTYRKIRRGGDFSRVVENIEHFLEERGRRGSTLPLLRLSFLSTSINGDELPAFIERWRGKADFFSIQRYGYYKGLTRKALFPKGPGVKDFDSGVCAQPFKRLSVRCSGEAAPCCDLSGMALTVGNVHRQSVKGIWGSPEMAGHRDSMKSPERLPQACRACQAKYIEETVDGEKGGEGE